MSAPWVGGGSNAGKSGQGEGGDLDLSGNSFQSGFCAREKGI